MNLFELPELNQLAANRPEQLRCVGVLVPEAWKMLLRNALRDRPEIRAVYCVRLRRAEFQRERFATPSWKLPPSRPQRLYLLMLELDAYVPARELRELEVRLSRLLAAPRDGHLAFAAVRPAVLRKRAPAQLEPYVELMNVILRRGGNAYRRVEAQVA